MIDILHSFDGFRYEWDVILTSLLVNWFFVHFPLMDQDDEAKVKTAFNTLLTYAKNVATNPNEEKFRKIRLSNAAFQVKCHKGNYYASILVL